MARAIWTGSVGFGLVQIPVSLHTAEEPEPIDLTLLDKRDLSPIGYERVNKNTGKKVEWGDIVKGYEHSEGKYVVLTEEDFEAANVEATRQIDILDFVEFADIDPRYFVRPYYLKPQKAGKKAYALLRETLHKTGKAGIGMVVIRTRQHLAAVTAHEKTLLLVLLRFADELRDEKDLDLPDAGAKSAGITPKELAMAEKLVEGMVSAFEPARYENEYHRDLMKLIEEKVKKGEVNQVPEHSKANKPKPKAKSNVIDLSELLARSVERKPKKRVDHSHASALPTRPGKAPRSPKMAPKKAPPLQHRKSA